MVQDHMPWDPKVPQGKGFHGVQPANRIDIVIEAGRLRPDHAGGGINLPNGSGYAAERLRPASRSRLSNVNEASIDRRLPEGFRSEVFPGLSKSRAVEPLGRVFRAAP